MTGVRLVPVPRAVAVAVTTGGGLDAALAGLSRAPDWPHADTADALRPQVEHGSAEAAHGTFLIVAGDRVVGECGWLGGVDAAGEAEIGYGLAASARGRGLAREAVALLCAWVEHQPGVRRVVAEALVGNEPSRRLLLGLGFAEEAAVPPYLRYGRDAPAWTGPPRSG